MGEAFNWQLLPKKIGVSNSDSRRHSQPRLPGSVVGEASMDPGGRGNKITEDNDL
jgi:hypothetical protein